jgi:AcrR family transcriptional regulator
MSSSRARAKPRTYHHGDLRRALIDAAFRALEHGRLEDVSLRGLARDVGVSPRAPYRHFQTKEELLAAVAAEGFRRWVSFATARLETAPADPLARLRTAIVAYVLHAVEHPAEFRVMYAPYATVAEGAPELLEARAGSHALMSKLIVDAQEAGVLRAGDPMPIALGLWSAMHGLSVLLVEGQLARFDRPVPTADVAGLVARLMFEGLMPRGPHR